MKSKITFLLLLCSAVFVNAQVEFEDQSVMDNSLFVQSPNSVFSADLDGDGDQDVLTSSYYGYSFLWFENLDGMGGDFALHTIATQIGTAWGVHAADLDGDGDMDAVVTSLTGASVKWYENTDGAGNFVLKQSMSASSPNFVMAADIDNDNDLDLVWSSSSEGEMKWIKNTDGQGTFGSSLNIESNVTGVPGFFPADFDGNGTLDIVTGLSINGSYVLTWYKNSNGMGSFGNSLQISNLVDNISSVYAGDIDGDGDADVVVSAGTVDAISWFENTDGLGTFGPQQVLAITGQSASRVKLTDVDGDSDLDVVFATNDEQKVIGWLENSDGMGNFGTEILIAPSSSSIREIYFSDMDADGDLDFLTAVSDNTIKLFKNTNGAGTYDPTFVTKFIDGGRVIRADDLDGDGDKDLVAASYWDSKISWYENMDGQGNFYNSQKVISTTVSGANSVAIADVDGDGFKDVLATSLLDDQIVWFKNADGLGTFGSPQIIESDLYQAYRVFLSDIDNDGDLDVFGLGYQRISWYENLDGQGSFSGQHIIASLGNTRMTSLDFGDLDGDGDLDIATTTSYGVYYYFNTDGQGTFGPVQVVDNPFGCQSVKIADLDNDGDKDIVYIGKHLNASMEPPFLRWAENGDGLGDFSEKHIISTILATPTSVVVADFDNDGDIDVASSDQGNGGVVAWYKNTDGQGSFENTQQIISQSLNSPYDIFAADMDNNNTIDIVSISEYDDKIVWHKNSIIPTSNGISGTVRFDFLGDGCNDTDAVLSGLMLVATDNTATNATFSQENGQFQFYTTEEGIVTTMITSQLPNYYAASPATYESDFEGLGNNDEINFCIVPTVVINDLNISFYPVGNDPRPGFDTAYRIIYKNVGTTQLSGTVTFDFDGSKLNFLNASQAVTTQTTNSLTFDFANLNPFETKTIDLDFNVFVPPVTNIGDFLTTTATITPFTEDYTEDDNMFSLSQIVVGSYDPNDITCLEGDEVLIEDADNYLHYLIRFQNTGTASAINVRVDHVLDDKLDWTTMQLESLSHAGQVNIRNGSEISFVFNNINLPDSTNDEPNSHGFIAFKIKPQENVALGNIIQATAAIYFDFNPPVITNAAATEFVNALSVENFEAAKVTVYPNPTDGILNIVTTTEIANVAIYNHLGQLVLSAVATSKIDMSSLRQGIYVMTLSDGTGTTYTQKIIKK